MSMIQNKVLAKSVETDLINSGKGSQDFVEDTTDRASDSALVDQKSSLPTVEGPVGIKDKENRIPSSRNEIPIAGDASITNSTKSLNIIFPSTSPNDYDHMFLLEKIAFIYIELVVRRGYKAMTNWPFRNLAR